jgi:hypothetical protein
MFVLGRVAAADMAADSAQTQMNPPVAGLETLFAPVSLRLDILN